MSPLYDDVRDVTEELWEKTVGLNLKGPYRLTALVGSRMFEGDGGSIVIVSSQAGVHATDQQHPVRRRQGRAALDDEGLRLALAAKGPREHRSAAGRVPHRHHQGVAGHPRRHRRAARRSWARRSTSPATRRPTATGPSSTSPADADRAGSPPAQPVARRPAAASETILSMRPARVSGRRALMTDQSICLRADGGNPSHAARAAGSASSAAASSSGSSRSSTGVVDRPRTVRLRRLDGAAPGVGHPALLLERGDAPAVQPGPAAPGLAGRHELQAPLVVEDVHRRVDPAEADGLFDEVRRTATRSRSAAFRHDATHTPRPVSTLAEEPGPPGRQVGRMVDREVELPGRRVVRRGRRDGARIVATGRRHAGILRRRVGTRPRPAAVLDGRTAEELRGGLRSGDRRRTSARPGRSIHDLHRDPHRRHRPLVAGVPPAGRRSRPRAHLVDRRARLGDAVHHLAHQPRRSSCTPAYYLGRTAETWLAALAPHDESTAAVDQQAA